MKVGFLMITIVYQKLWMRIEFNDVVRKDEVVGLRYY